MSDKELAAYEEKLAEGKHMRINRLDDSLFSKDLAPHYMKLAGQLASSELVPKSFRGKPQDLFLCWAMGYSIGMSPEQSMQCIAVINGRACMWGDEMLALCMAHKDFVDIIEEPIYKGDTITGYNCTVKRKNRADKINPFTLDMAKKAGLLAKGGVWVQYPERMLKLRARGLTLRDAFPDALKGIKSREEVEDYIDAEYSVVENKGSRTEQLKNDYLKKTGRHNDKETANDASPDENNEAPGEDKSGKEHSQVAQSEEKTIDLHTEIRRLIDEKSFAEERLTKALEYYEADTIDDLSIESAENFIDTLKKL